jgi:hypothetical protein
MKARYGFTVKTDIPNTMRALGFVAYVEDANHPDGGPLSLSWHQSLLDAERVAEALNRDCRPYLISRR